MSPGRRSRGRWARPALRWAGGRLGGVLLRASRAVTRMRYLHEEREREAITDYGAAIYAFWHGRFWLPAASLRRTRAAVLVSLSEDGELIAQAVRSLGFLPVRGSSSRRGKEGLRELAELVRRGRSAALTPDGPRGPKQVAQMGTVVLAAETGKPILPLGAASHPSWVLGSWDSFQVPRPGARGVIVFGEPFVVPAGGDLEPWRLHLEQALNAAQGEADEAVGRGRGGR